MFFLYNKDQVPDPNKGKVTDPNKESKTFLNHLIYWGILIQPTVISVLSLSGHITNVFLCCLP